jgi:hypothetical protein
MNKLYIVNAKRILSRFEAKKVGEITVYDFPEDIQKKVLKADIFIIFTEKEFHVLKNRVDGVSHRDSITELPRYLEYFFS